MKKLTFFLCFSGLTCLLFAQEKLQNRTPVEKFADLLINYSLQLKPNESVLIITTHEVRELNLELFKQAVLAGAYPTFFYDDNEFSEIYFQYASNELLKHPNDNLIHALKTTDAFLTILATTNVKSLRNVNPEKFQIEASANKEYSEIWNRRIQNNELKWCYALYPTPAQAQEAGMGTLGYRDFVFGAGKLYDPDPIKSWTTSSADQSRWVNWLAGKKLMKLKGAYIDMTLSIENRK